MRRRKTDPKDALTTWATSGASRAKHVSVCVLVSILVTASAVALDTQRSSVQQIMAGLKWARQVATQAEGMVFKAKEQGEKDPVGWAVSYLAQGVEPRAVHVTRTQVTDASAQNSENYSIDRAAGTFDYTRILTPEDGTGIRVQLVQGYLGFLGTQSPLASDFAIFALFALCFGIVFLRTGRYFGFDDARRLRLLVSEWATGSKAQLTRHGIHVREMVRESQRLAVSAGESRRHVESLRNGIHAGLTELHESRAFYKDGDNIATQAESLALNMAIEANRLGGDARRIADMATELHRKLQSLHSVNRKGQLLVQRIERQVEPWAADADQAYHSFDAIREATQLLGKHIRNTTESLVGQAKLVQKLNRDLGVGGDVRPAQEQPAESRLADKEEEPALTAPAENEAKFGESTAMIPAQPRLPDPLPPIEDRGPGKPKLARQIRILQRKIRHRKSA